MNTLNPLRFLHSSWVQTFPAPAIFTEKDVRPGSQEGRVFIVTGGNSGIGYALIDLLYPTGATIYMASRSYERATKAIASIRDAHKNCTTASRLEFLHLDLADLHTVQSAAETFASRESRLDVLFNNAGIGSVPIGSTTAQGIEAHLGTNCVGPLMFTEKLLPQLLHAVPLSPVGTVRVVWTSSLSVELFSPWGGINFATIDNGKTTRSYSDYGASKVGNWFLAEEAARRWKLENNGIVSAVLNPGLLDTNVWQHQPRLLVDLIRPVFMAPPIQGAYTMLYAGFSPDLGAQNDRAYYIVPSGKIMQKSSRVDIEMAIENGKAAEFWNWCESKWDK